MAVTSTFWYLKNIPLYKDTKPYIINLPLSHIPTSKLTNQECFPQSNIRVNDIRLVAYAFTLDNNGFEISTSIPLSLSYAEFSDSNKVRDVYCQGVKEVLLSKTGAESAHILHQMVRRRHSSFPEKPRGSKEAETDQPVQGVHCDYTPRQAYESVRSTFGQEHAQEIWNKRRVQIIQAWRPFRGAVVDWPLAVCDVNSVYRDIDLVATDNVWPCGVSETYNVLFSPRHSWYFISNQTQDETLLFKGFDNAKGVSTFCPHASFQDGQAQDVTARRESVECAILLVYPDPST